MATDDPMMASVAGRYAAALFDLANDGNDLAGIAAELDAFDRLLADSADLRRLVRSPVFSAEEQDRAISAILERSGARALTRNFFKLLVRNRRLYRAPDAIKAFRALLARARGEIAAEIVSAHPLNDEQMRTLKETLAASAGKEVRIAARVDPALLGGLVVKIGSRMIDSSLRTRLNNLKFAMKETR
ncbi:MAG: F0F1 ATP synthase subunit delta [Hyphomicrobiaceae bacterium]